MLIEHNICMDVRSDLQDMLYDQLNHYIKGDLLSDIQMNGISQVFESYRKATVYGKKKTAENVRRAPDRVARPEVASNLASLESKCRTWNKNNWRTLRTLVLMISQKRHLCRYWLTSCQMKSTRKRT